MLCLKCYDTRRIRAAFSPRVAESCCFRVQLPDTVYIPDGKDTRAKARAFQNSGTVDKDTVAVKGKKQGPDGRVKLDESRGFGLTINVPLQTCTCADLLALGRSSM